MYKYDSRITTPAIREVHESLSRTNCRNSSIDDFIRLTRLIEDSLSVDSRDLIVHGAEWSSI
jgi:hypothetical protein